MASPSDTSAPPRAKRQRSEGRLLTLKLQGPSGTGVAMPVRPDEKHLTVQEWLQKMVKPTDGPWAELSVKHDRAFDAPVKLDATLESLGLFTKQNHTIVLDVSHAGAQLEILDRTRELRERVSETPWGKRIPDGGVGAELALSSAIAKAVNDPDLEDLNVDQRLQTVRGMLRNRPYKWTVALDASTAHGAGPDGAPMFWIGDEMSLTIRCIDAIGLSAQVKETTLTVKVEAEKQLGFEFTRKLKPEHQTTGPGGLKFGDKDADSADLAWHDVKIFCFPKEQPRGVEEAFTLTVSANARTKGSSVKFYVAPEETMNGVLPEIDAKLVHKWWDHPRVASLAPPRGPPVLTHGGHVSILRHPSETEQVVRELLEFPTSLNARREFLKDVTVWQLVGDKCGDKVVARMSSHHGWFLDRDTKRAGFCMHKYDRSLDDRLSTDMMLRERFDKCEQVLQIMIKLQEEFPFLMFPDIKPKNFLCSSRASSNTTDGDFTIVLSDLDDVRRIGSSVSTHTAPYRHPAWQDGLPTQKIFEQHAVAVTMLQILLGMKSQVAERLGGGRAWLPLNFVDRFTPPPDASDQYLSNLRESNPSDPRLIEDIKAFFKTYLLKKELPEGRSEYTQMKIAMADLGSRAEKVAQSAATSASAIDGFMINGRRWQMKEWQVTLLSKITAWESNLAGMRTFTPPYEQGKRELFDHFQTLKKVVGKPSHTSHNRTDMVARVRSIAETILLCIIRRIYRDQTLDPSTLQGAMVQQVFQSREVWGKDWPKHALDRLRFERDDRFPTDCRPSTRQLDGFYYHPLSTGPSWIAKGATNIERLYKALHYLRDKTNCAHHDASRDAREELEELIKHENIHVELFGRLDVLFCGDLNKTPQERRILQ